MPGYLDTVFVPLAIDMIAKFGVPAILRRKAGTYTASAGSVSESDTDYDVIITPPTPQREMRFKNALYQVGDAKCMVAAGDLAIEPSSQSDFVVHQGVLWEILQVDTVWSGLERAAYLMYLRK